MEVSNQLDYDLYISLIGRLPVRIILKVDGWNRLVRWRKVMVRIAFVAVLVAILGMVSASAQRGGPQRGPQRGLNPEGQPRELRAGAPHRYYAWHDSQGWHLRTTTAGERHRFHGEIVATDGGKI